MGLAEEVKNMQVTDTYATCYNQIQKRDTLIWITKRNLSVSPFEMVLVKSKVMHERCLLNQNKISIQEKKTSTKFLIREK